MTPQDKFREACKHLAEKWGNRRLIVGERDGECYITLQVGNGYKGEYLSEITQDFLDELAEMLGYWYQVNRREYIVKSGLRKYSWIAEANKGVVRIIEDAIFTDDPQPDKLSAALEAVTAIIYQAYPNRI